MGSASYLIQHVKLHQKVIILVYDMNSLKDIEENLKGDWVRVPPSKKNLLGAFLKWSLHLILFSMSNC